MAYMKLPINAVLVLSDWRARGQGAAGHAPMSMEPDWE